jgi:hypothetical protein
VKRRRFLLLHLRLSRAPIFLLGVYVMPKVSSSSQAVWQDSHFRRGAHPYLRLSRTSFSLRSYR